MPLMLTLSDAVLTLDRDLHVLFGDRLKSVVAYGSVGGANAPSSTLAIVNRLTADDLRACATRVPDWNRDQVAAPLLLAADEFERSLDTFPFEFGGILADHVLVSGTDPFRGLSVDAAHLRQACELQARSHLLHLRQGYLETGGRSDAVADLISRSAGSLAALLTSVARLQGGASDTVDAASQHVERGLGLAPGILSEVAACALGRPLNSDRARALFPEYLDAVSRLTNFIDRWSVRDK